MSFDNYEFLYCFVIILIKSLCAREPGLFASPAPARLPMPFPTPHPAASSLFTGLSDLIKKPASQSGHDGPMGLGSGQCDDFSSKNVNLSNNLNPNFTIPMARSLFSPPSKFSNIQRSLHSLYAAKSYVYGSTFFGRKAFYASEFDFQKQPVHPHDRRKIRFGLKGLVDFVIQLDLENLKTCLYEPDSAVAKFTENHFVQPDLQFSPDSCMGLIYRTNPSKCILINQIFERLSSNLNFSQSMGEFLASDGSIETTKLVISEALKRGPDLGQFLRGGPFASCAQIYQNLSSKYDFDAAFFLALKQANSRNDNQLRSAQNAKVNYPRVRDFGKPRFTSGFCFKFQRWGRCNSNVCFFKHECADCGSKDHGADDCRRRKNQISEKGPRARIPFIPSNNS